MKEDTNLTGFAWRNTSKNDDIDLVTGVYLNGGIVHWNSSTGEVVERIKSEEEGLNCIEYREDGEAFVVGTTEGNLDLYDVTRNGAYQRLSSSEKHSNRVIGFKFLP